MTHSARLTVAAIVPTLTPDRARVLASRLCAEVDAVVIIDNASAVPRQQSDGPVTVVAAGHNLGYGQAVMLGVSLSTHDLILVLNDDVVPGPGFVAAMTRPFTDPDLFAVAAHLRIQGRPEVDSLGLALDRTLRSVDVREPPGIPAVVGPSGAAAAYRRRTFTDLGGFSPELFAYWEDVDLALRMWSAGLTCRVAEDAVAEHARGSTLGLRSPRQRELDAFGRGFVLGRYTSWLSVIDRLCVPLVDWPSLLRSCWKLRSLSVLTARAAGRRAGSRRPQAPPARPLPRTPARATLARQFAWRGSHAGASSS